MWPADADLLEGHLGGPDECPEPPEEQDAEDHELPGERHPVEEREHLPMVRPGAANRNGFRSGRSSTDR